MRRAFVIGNAVYDELFAVRALPRAGESVLGTARFAGLGGKGANQAVILSRTGVRTRLAAAIGTDAQAGDLRAALAREPLEPVLFARPDLPTDRSVVIAQEDGENTIVTTNNSAASLTLPDCREALQTAGPGDLVLLQGNLAEAVTRALAELCRDRGLALVFNPSPFRESFRALLPLVQSLFVNAAEARDLCGLTGAPAVEALCAAGARRTVLTMGAGGALLGTGGQVQHMPACATDPVDVTGAGDCFEGVAMGSAILRGTDLDLLALRHASLAAARTISRPGAAAAFPDRAELAALLRAPMDP